MTLLAVGNDTGSLSRGSLGPFATACDCPRGPKLRVGSVRHRWHQVSKVKLSPIYLALLEVRLLNRYRNALYPPSLPPSLHPNPSHSIPSRPVPSHPIPSPSRSHHRALRAWADNKGSTVQPGVDSRQLQPTTSSGHSSSDSSTLTRRHPTPPARPVPRQPG